MFIIESTRYKPGFETKGLIGLFIFIESPFWRLKSYNKTSFLFEFWIKDKENFSDKEYNTQELERDKNPENIQPEQEKLINHGCKNITYKTFFKRKKMRFVLYSLK